MKQVEARVQANDSGGLTPTGKYRARDHSIWAPSIPTRATIPALLDWNLTILLEPFLTPLLQPVQLLLSTPSTPASIVLCKKKRQLTIMTTAEHSFTSIG